MCCQSLDIPTGRNTLWMRGLATSYLCCKQGKIVQSGRVMPPSWGISTGQKRVLQAAISHPLFNDCLKVGYNKSVEQTVSC